MTAYHHHLSGIYPDARSAYRASSQLSRFGLPAERIHVLKPDDPAVVSRLQRARNPLSVCSTGTTLLGAGLGGLLGFIFLAIAQGRLSASGDTVMMFAVIMLAGAAAGGVAGAVISLNVKDTQSLELVSESVRHGHWAIVVDTADDEDTQVSRILAHSTAAFTTTPSGETDRRQT